MRGLWVGVCTAATLVAGMTGCSNKEKSDSSMSSTSGSTTSTTSASANGGSASGRAAAGTAKVSIDGQPKDINGQVVCSTMGGNFTITIGETGTGVAVVMSPDASRVTSVGLGNVNGAVLGFQEGALGGNASATKDDNTYTITGTATGVDMANPLQPITKPFEIEVTCP